MNTLDGMKQCGATLATVVGVQARTGQIAVFSLDAGSCREFADDNFEGGTRTVAPTVAEMA